MMDSPARLAPKRTRRTSLSLANQKTVRKMTSLTKLFSKNRDVVPRDENTCTPSSQLRSPVQLPSPSKQATALFPATSPLKASTNENKQPRSHLNFAATAPAADRRSKRFDLSHWESELPAISAASPSPAVRSSLLLPRLQIPAAHRPSALKASRKPDNASDEDDDSPFRVGPVRRASSLKDRQNDKAVTACSPSRSTPAGLFSSAYPPQGLSSAPPLLRHKLSRDLTMSDLSSACSDSPSITRAHPRPNSHFFSPARSALSASHPQPSPARVWSSSATTAAGVDLIDQPPRHYKDTSEASAGAPFLDSLCEDESNEQFAPRTPHFATEDVDMLPPPPAVTEATPRRRRSQSAHSPTTTASNLGGATFASFSSLPRKRNANGAIILGPARASLLGANSPIVAIGSSPYGIREREAMDSDGEDDEDEAMGRSLGVQGMDENSPISSKRSMSPPPLMTDSSSIASSLASSRNSSNSLRSSLSSSASMGLGGSKARRLSADISALDGAAASSQFSHIKPLQAAFSSAGLISKKLKARDSGVSVDTPPASALRPRLAPSFGQQSLLIPEAPAVVHPAAARIIKPMPNTPCKPGPFQASLSGVDTRMLDPSPPKAADSAQTHLGTSSGGSPNQFNSSTLPLLRYKAGRRSAPFFRRRSSGQLNQELGVHRSGGSSSAGSVDYEPMTPTRGPRNSLSTDAPLFPTTAPAVPSPLSPGLPTASPVAAPCTTPVSTTFPTDLSGFPTVRPKPPPLAQRPSFQHRHSGSVIMTVRQREQNKPDRFGSDFRVVRVIGSGVTSEAFAVQAVECGTVSAIKRTRVPFGGPKDRIRRLEEVDILRELSNGSPSSFVVELFDAWEQNNHLYIQTELCEHGNLAEFLSETGRFDRLDEARVWKIACEIALGISYIHSHQIIHLDIKPANIFITQHGTLKVGDFGLAIRWPRASTFDILQGAGVDSPVVDEAVGCRDWTRSQPMNSRPRSKSIGLVEATDLEREGDREYIAPEVLSGIYGKPADVFSFGLLLLEASANVILPDNGNAWRKLRANDFSDINVDISPPLFHLIRSLSQSTPTQRITIDDTLKHPVLSCLAQRSMGSNSSLRGAVVEENEGFLDDLLSEAAEARHPSSMDI